MLLLLLSVQPIFHAGAQSRELQRFGFEEPCMGTLFRVQVYAPDSEKAWQAAQRAFAEAQRLEGLFSDYRPDSELMQMCRREVGVSHGLTEELAKVLSQSQQLYRLSRGAFDVTTGHVTREWRRTVRRGQLPGEAEISRALNMRGMAALILNEQDRTVTFRKPGMLIDLGGIAKGYAADRMLGVLQAEGFPVATVSAGGDLRVGAPPPGSAGWEIVLRPFGAGGEAQGTIKVVLADCAVSTSGSVHQFVEIDGRRYSHIVDPSTGLGIDPGLACTVIAGRGLVSDPLATACCVLGIEKGLALADELGVEILFAVDRGGRAGEMDAANIRFSYSSGFPSLLVETGKSIIAVPDLEAGAVQRQ